MAFALNGVLPEGLVARPEKRVVLEYDEEEDDPDSPPAPGRPRQVKADVRVVAAAAYATYETYPESAAGGLATLARPGTVAVRVLDDPATQKYVEVRDARGDRVVTVVEMLSPWNKREPGRAEFLQRRRELLDGGANVVEIDLIRTGNWRRMFTGRLRLPRSVSATYRVTARLAEPDAAGDDLYVTPMPLREALPPLAVPLRRGEPPAVVELQPPLDQVYVGNRYGQSIDYARPPDPPLEADDAAWAAGLLAAETNEPAAAS